MTPDEQMKLFTAFLSDEEDLSEDVIKAYLLMAEDKMLKRLYPFGTKPSASVPLQYRVLQVRLAVRLYSRRGGEGEISHNEPSASRTYDSPNDEDILSEIVPYAVII